jgi:hypothetical protein
MIDQISDKNHSKLHYLYSAVEFPQFVKEAEITEYNRNEIPASAFADKYNRRYPIDSPASTWLSNLYFQKYAAEYYNDYQYSEIKDKLHKAANLWNVDLDYKFKKEFIEKNAADNTHTIMYKHGSQILAKVHICAPEDLEKVAEDILINYKKYTYDIRKNVAQQILKTAVDMNITFERDCQSALEKTAGWGVGTTDHVLNILNTRKNLLKDKTEICGKIDESIEMVKKAEDRGFVKYAALQKIAGFVDAIDRLTDLHHPCLNAPEIDLFSKTIQDQKDIEKHAVILPNQKIILKSKLESNKEAVDKYLDEVCNKKKLNEISSHQADYLTKILN